MEENEKYKVSYTFDHVNQHPYLADGYKVYRQDGEQAEYVLIDTLNAEKISEGEQPVSITGVDYVPNCGTLYNYKVSAYNERGEIECINPLFSGINFICPTLTPTVSPSLSATVTPSISVSRTASVTPTNSPPVTNTPSLSPSISPSLSISVTPSKTLTPTVTPSVSKSVSVTPSTSLSLSVTPSVSKSVSVTPSKSVTPTVTPSLSLSVSPSTSISVTPSQSLSLSITPSVSKSVSVTPSTSLSVSVTPSKSVTPTVTPSLSLSVTPSTSLSVTPSQSLSLSVTPSVSKSVSVTPSMSLSLSVTPSKSVTPTVTPSLSLSVTPSTSLSVTPSQSLSLSVTPSVSKSVSVTPSTSLSLSVTPSRSVTPSTSPPGQQPSEFTFRLFHDGNSSITSSSVLSSSLTVTDTNDTEDNSLLQWPNGATSFELIAVSPNNTLLDGNGDSVLAGEKLDGTVLSLSSPEYGGFVNDAVFDFNTFLDTYNPRWGNTSTSIIPEKFIASSDADGLWDFGLVQTTISQGSQNLGSRTTTLTRNSEGGSDNEIAFHIQLSQDQATSGGDDPSNNVSSMGTKSIIIEAKGKWLFD